MAAESAFRSHCKTCAGDRAVEGWVHGADGVWRCRECAEPRSAEDINAALAQTRTALRLMDERRAWALEEAAFWRRVSNPTSAEPLTWRDVVRHGLSGAGCLLVGALHHLEWYGFVVALFAGANLATALFAIRDVLRKRKE